MSYIGLSGTWHVRDLWRQLDLPDAKGVMRLTLPPHGVTLLKLVSSQPK
jgi:hypothetical protein